MTKFSLTNPPLICVSARVQFTRVAKIAEFIPDLQEAFRLKGYPHFQEQQNKAWSVNQQAEAGTNLSYEEISRWSFANLDKTIVIRVDRESVTLFFADYYQFEKAHPHYLEILEIVERVIPLLTLMQLQLRYINHIPVGPEESPAEWVRASVLGVPKVGNLIRHGSVSETVFQTLEGWGVVVRCSALAKGLILPSDILPLEIKLKNDYKLHAEYPFVLLENVIMREPSSPKFNHILCMNDISELRQYIEEIFTATVTTESLTKWQ